MTFYDDMAAMARDLLKPADQGGFGQGVVKLLRIEETPPPPDKPWEGGQTENKEEVIDAAVSGVSSKLVGTEVGGVVLNSTDLMVLSIVPKQGYVSGDIMTIDGRAVKILGVQPIPAAGTTSAYKFFVRG